MWPSRRRRESVICLACGDRLDRSNAREYDKYGDRWERSDKEFEHLCRSCHHDLCHHPRDELEALLVDLETAASDTDDFLSAYIEAVENRYGTLEER